MIRCQHCGAETSNGLALCALCQEYARSCLEFLPVYFRNLARWRPGRTGTRPVPGSRVLYDGPSRSDGTGDRISDRLDEAMTMATTRARELVKDRSHFVRPLTFTDAVLSDDLPADLAEELNDDPARAMTALCAGFEEHLTSIATLDWCGDFVRDLDQHETALRRLTEVAVPGWYAGACRKCGSPTYIVPGLTWVTCSHKVVTTGEDGRRRVVDVGCGATTYARDHLDVVLAEARDWIARPRALAQAIVALVDTEPSVPRLYDRIRKWSEREALVPIRRVSREHVYDADLDSIVVADVEQGPARYRLGDVLDLVLATRGSKATDAKAAAVS